MENACNRSKSALEKFCEISSIASAGSFFSVRGNVKCMVAPEHARRLMIGFNCKMERQLSTPSRRLMEISVFNEVSKNLMAWILMVGVGAKESSTLPISNSSFVFSFIKYEMDEASFVGCK